MNNVTSRNLPAELRVSGRPTVNADTPRNRQIWIVAIITAMVFGGIWLRYWWVFDPTNPGNWLIFVVLGSATFGAFLPDVYRYFGREEADASFAYAVLAITPSEYRAELQRLRRKKR